MNKRQMGIRKIFIISILLIVILFMVFPINLIAVDLDAPKATKDIESLRDAAEGQNVEPSSLPEVVLPYIVRKVQKSIVSIRTIKKEKVVEFDNEGNPFFEEKIISTLSGIIINSEGYILTCRSAVANNPEKIEVILHPEEKVIEAKLVGTDERSDLAVLKIDSSLPLSPAQLGDSDKTRIREWIYTIGEGGCGLIGSIGVISARRKSSQLNLKLKDVDIFQIDVNLPSESAGGALVNMKGEVIGVLYKRITDGVNYAISISSAKQVIDAIIKHEK